MLATIEAIDNQAAQSMGYASLITRALEIATQKYSAGQGRLAASQVLPKPYSGKQICDHLIVFSGTFPAATALPPNADIDQQGRDVRYAPTGDIAAASAAVFASSKKTRPIRKQARRFSSGRLETDDGARKIPDTSCCGTESSGPRVRCRRQERRQEHERAFGRLAVRHHRSDGQRPERDLIGARPRDRWIIDLVARRCELQHHLESDRSMSNALANLVFEIVGRRLGDLVLRQEMSAVLAAAKIRA